MGSILDKFEKAKAVSHNINNVTNKQLNKKKKHNFDNPRLKDRAEDTLFNDEFDNDEFDNFDNFNDDVNIQPAQKSESFHHYVLESRYQETEKSIRGYKDVYNKATLKWEVKRKKTHCFTDEEAEEIVRASQSFLATDIKLGIMTIEAYGITMMMIYKRLSNLFRNIAEYRYGRYSYTKDNKPIANGYAIQHEMKMLNLKIFLELFERIRANYSRSVAGQENKATHQSVSGQESLQSTESLEDKKRGYM